MIDLNDLRNRPEVYKKACEDKRIGFDVDAFLELDQKRRQLVSEMDTLREQLNALSKAVPKLRAEEKQEKLAELKELSARVKESTVKEKEIEEEWHRSQLYIPSIPLDKVPFGKDDTENVELSKWGVPKEFDFKVRDHIELGKSLGIIDIERGVKIAGARNYFLVGDGARLQHALLNYAVDFIAKRGFKLMDTPHIVSYQTMAGTGYFPGGEEMSYHFDERDDDFYLIGTSEVALVGFYGKETFNLDQLPIKVAGYSPCYRREAGSYGKDTHGLYRVHQFYKVEQVVICEADAAVSEKHHRELLNNAEGLMQSLGLPYRVVDVCSGDLGQGQLYKNDIEAWMPSRKSYSETHSCSTLHEFQSRRLGIKYKNASGKKVLCHTLNNTLVASPRILIPLIENNQNENGTISIPKVLQPYMGGQEKIEPS